MSDKKDVANTKIFTPVQEADVSSYDVLKLTNADVQRVILVEDCPEIKINK